jgi:hypothetical protein
VEQFLENEMRGDRRHSAIGGARAMTWALPLLASLSLLGACATTLQANSDFDSAQDFSRYRSFAWMVADSPIAAPGEQVRVSPLNRQRIVEAIEAELGAKGFQKAADGSAADFVISYTVGARDRIDAQSYPDLYRGPWRWSRPYIGRNVDVSVYREGTLAIDIFDGASHQPVWHGWASKRITEHDVTHAAEQIPPAVAAILEKFPPR